MRSKAISYPCVFDVVYIEILTQYCDELIAVRSITSQIVAEFVVYFHTGRQTYLTLLTELRIDSAFADSSGDVAKSFIFDDRTQWQWFTMRCVVHKNHLQMIGRESGTGLFFCCAFHAMFCIASEKVDTGRQATAGNPVAIPLQHCYLLTALFIQAADTFPMLPHDAFVPVNADLVVPIWKDYPGG